MILWLLACANNGMTGSNTVLAMEQVTLSAPGGVEASAATVALVAPGRGKASDVVATLPGSKALEIRAPVSDWDLSRRVAVFEGGVTATRGDLTLTCDRLDVTYRDRDRVEKATATGNVRIVQGERTGHSERAALHADSGEVVLEGSPELVEGPNRMVGDRITLFLDTDRIRCDVCKVTVDGDAVRPQ